MSRRITVIVLSAAGSLLVLLAGGAVVAEEPAELVVRNAKIVTVDDEFRVVEAMAVRDGRIVAVGTDEAVQKLAGEKTRTVDLEGRMVLPGLIDSHVHPTGASRFEADHEIPSMESIADVLAYVRSRTKVVPEGEWITVSQVFITRLKEQRFPSRSELDSVAPDHPVLFRTGPDGSVNSLALKENGIDAEFAEEHPDQVLVDPESGEPNGLIRRQSSLIKTRPNPAAKKLTQAEQDQRLVELIRDYNKVGLTGVIDRNCNDSARTQYERLLNDELLTIRMRMSRSLSPNSELSRIRKRLDEIAADRFFQKPDPRLAVIGVKVFEDGGMLTGSAFFNRPWGVSSIYGITDPRYRGMQYIDEERLEALIGECVKRNLAFTAHCQGDAAVEALVGAYDKVNAVMPVGPTHSTITHSSFMSPKAIQTASRLGVGVDLQPAWLYLDARTLIAQFGTERLAYFIPLRTLFESEVVAGGGSDHMQKIGSLRSVNPYNPFLGMWVAVTRSARWYDEPVHAEQALDRQQMLRFYTINNAWLMRSEDEVGSLEVGKRADFIVIDRDLLECPADQIRDTQVLSTWLDGETVFEQSL